MMVNEIHLLHLLAVISLLCVKTLSFGSEYKDGDMTRCIARERRALLVFKQGLLHRHNLLPSWGREEEDCCKWRGVGCDNSSGHVTYLNLSSLISSSFLAANNVSITTHSLVLGLPHVKYLDLSYNFFDGHAIPEFIGSLTELVHLDLSFAYFGGPIPDQIGNLTNLQYLNLSSNPFLGPIPSFIGSLTNLRYLDLSNCFFSGAIPHEFKNLSKLHSLDLGYNYELGIPNFEWLFNLSSLTQLDLSSIIIGTPINWGDLIQKIPSMSTLTLNYCNLSTSPPYSTNFSSSITALHLHRNLLDSSIFHWLTNVSGSLAELDIGSNHLEGEIPEFFGHMTALTRLDLDNNLLKGPIPSSFARMTAITHLNLYANQLHGVLSKSISDLSNLKFADFTSNKFTGDLQELSHWLARDTLQVLLISENQLTGSLPDITQFSSLRELQVNSNQLNGYLPTYFEHRSALQILDLSNNHLKGSLPDFTGFSSLRFLSLYNNKFSGSLPDFRGCSSLQILLLGENQFTEWKTQSIGQLHNLKKLDLSKNSIHSTITEAHLSNLSSLEYMNTSVNSLTVECSSGWLPPFQISVLNLASCKLGPKFPNWIQNQRYINALDISNTQISDTIPIWFWNISRSMKLLNMSYNKIRGKFSAKLVYIQEMDLSSNYFEGPVPKIPAECLKINLSENKFSGTLLSLSVVKDISLLRFLDLSHNRLFGELPDSWMQFQGLVFLNLGHNNLSGRIPNSMGNLVSLQTLILRNNKLYGELPASLRNCSTLGFADFGFNKLSGKIPSWIGEDLQQLYALILKSNGFDGSIPYHICHLSALHFLDLSINRISGNIPQCFVNLTAMIRKETVLAEHIYSSTYSSTSIITSSDPPTAVAPTGKSYSYYDSVVAGWKGQEIEYGRNFAYLKMIDLSTNKLTGEVPIGITRLLDLRGLNLSRNKFQGQVPLEIGKLKELESLDLSTNKFSGKIPPSMSELNYLAYLDISNNNFSGRIPPGTQLQGFSVSTYEGNIGLCGPPLTKTCPGDEPADVQPSPRKHEVDEDKSEYMRWLYINAALGFSTTFWGIFGTLLLSHSCRHAYFLLLDKLKDRFYVAIAVRIARLQTKVEGLC